MKIAIVYNRASKRVVNLFGVPNREKYGLKSIKRITDALKAGGHQVIALEGDKDLLDRLEEFMPRVLKGERPGMVFNLSYGIQGQARYTHVPGMLEMAGIPYVGSGPLAHSLALDKVVAKMLFRQNNLPTPDFAVIDDLEELKVDLVYPLIVKPRNEAVSFGLKIVNDEAELREAAGVILDKFQQPVLVERYISGREVNVGLLGNDPPVALPPAELVFGEGQQIYTYEDKTHRSGREIHVRCPADIPDELKSRAQEVAAKAFKVLGCFDCARVDMRLDEDSNLYILEVNSLPSLGEHGSYVHAAASFGLDFPALVNRLVDVAAARYFGTPSPVLIEPGERDPGRLVFGYLTSRRDRLEKRLEEWTRRHSRTSDPIGMRGAVAELSRQLTDVGLRPREDLTNETSAWCWESAAGLDGGTLLVGHLDVPVDLEFAAPGFRRETEQLVGEGIGSSRAPLVMLLTALGALKSVKRLRATRLGVLYYTDEGRDCRYSAETIRRACERAGEVLVLRPGSAEECVITQRRGRRKYRLRVEGTARRPGQATRRPELLLQVCRALDEIAALSSRKDGVSVSPVDLETERYPMTLPHRVSTTLLVTYLEAARAPVVEERMREVLGALGRSVELDLVSDRPPMRERRASQDLFGRLEAVAKRWEVPLGQDSSVWPSAAGLVPESVPVVCGLGPVATHLHSPQEGVQRISLVRRTLLLAQYLVSRAADGAGA